MTIGEKIREERKKHNMTQKQLTDATGINDSTIRKYESGKLNPKPATIRKLAKGLGIHPSKLTYENVIPIPDDATKGDMILDLFKEDIENGIVEINPSGTKYMTIRVSAEWWNTRYKKYEDVSGKLILG